MVAGTILGLACGQPDGSAEILLKEALRAAEQDGASVRVVRLVDLALPTDPTPGSDQPDDAWWLWERLLEADGIVISTPIMSRTVAARLKVVVDRLLGPNADVAIIANLLSKEPFVTASQQWHRDLSTVLHDLAWLLPRTIGAGATRDEPLPASELEVMRLLTRRPGLSVNEIAERLSLRSSNVSTAVGALAARGLLRRVRDEDDRRIIRVSPTDEALRFRSRREDSWGLAMAGATADLSSEHRTLLREATAALRALADELARHER